MPRGVRAAFRALETRRGSIVAAPTTTAAAVGETFEALCGVPRNNRGTGDLYGVELKAALRTAIGSGTDDLFLREPHFTHGLDSRRFLSRYGYRDGSGRRAFKRPVTMASTPLHLTVSRRDSAVVLAYRRGGGDRQLASWSFASLQSALDGKLRDTVFVTARRVANGFVYESAVWSSLPSLERLLSLIEAGELWVEFRMHSENGRIRNHGTQFRIRSRSLPRLFSSSIQMQ